MTGWVLEFYKLIVIQGERGESRSFMHDRDVACHLDDFALAAEEKSCAVMLQKISHPLKRDSK